MAQSQQMITALRHALIDLKASRTLVQHTMGEPHGLNQTIALVEAALSVPEEITGAEMDAIEAAAIAGKPLTVPASGDVRAAVIEECLLALHKRLPYPTEACAIIRALSQAPATDAGARIEDLETALRFYADGRRYQGANQRPIPDDPYAKPDAVYIMDVTRDLGAIANAALRGVA